MKQFLLSITLLLFCSCSTTSKLYYEKSFKEAIKQIGSVGGLYSFKNRVKTTRGYEWEVWYDASGLWRKVDSVEVWKVDQTLFIKSGNERVNQQVIELLTHSLETIKVDWESIIKVKNE